MSSRAACLLLLALLGPCAIVTGCATPRITRAPDAESPRRDAPRRTERQQYWDQVAEWTEQAAAARGGDKGAELSLINALSAWEGDSARGAMLVRILAGVRRRRSIRAVIEHLSSSEPAIQLAALSELNAVTLSQQEIEHLEGKWSIEAARTFFLAWFKKKYGSLKDE